jgi:uncharacterized protein (TIGR02145 family)
MKQENQCAEQIRVLPGFSQIPKICWIFVREILSPKMFKLILLLLCVWLSISLNAQVINSQSLESVGRNKQNTSFNLEEIKVRWKKAALENCQGVPCIITPPPGPASTACGSTTSVSDVDGNNYNTVAIGTQCWTKENLRVTKYNDGITPIDFDASGGPLGNVSQTWSVRSAGAFTIYDNETSTQTNATNYGFLYNWYAAAGIITSGGSPTKNICPLGWHVPTDAEWTILIQTLDPSQLVNSGNILTLNGSQSTIAGGKLKAKGTTFWSSPNQDATDETGFSALPGGYRQNSGGFNDILYTANFWSATAFDATFAWKRYLYYFDGDIYREYNVCEKETGMSVRCLKNSLN